MDTKNLTEIMAAVGAVGLIETLVSVIPKLPW